MCEEYLEVKIDPEALDGMIAFLKEKGIDVTWTDEREGGHFYDGPPKAGTEDDFIPYCNFPGVIRSTYRGVGYIAEIMNEILHYHQKVNIPIMLLTVYQNCDGFGYVKAYEAKDGKGKVVAYTDSNDN